VGFESTGAVTWLSETAPDPDEPPPQATRTVDSKEIQTASDACVKSFRAKAQGLETQQTCEGRYFILENTVDGIKQKTDRLITV
jgi:hypothetical protein